MRPYKYKYDILQRLSQLQSYTDTGDLMQDIRYDYDEVSNITSITNYAGILTNGLGGKYKNTYKYDSLYRLLYSEGDWLGSSNTNYKLEMSYLPNGRISKKTLSAGIVTKTPSSNSFSTVSYDNVYHYMNFGQPNTLTYIDNSPQQDFAWDAKGNMTYHNNSGLPLERFLCWDEQNRLQGVRDEKYLSVYQYDANGERTCKLTGEYTSQNVNGQWRYFYRLDNPTLYTSPYLVVTSRGYTKHYYAESERVASKLGNGGLYDIDSSLADETQEQEKFVTSKEHARNIIYECLQTDDARVYTSLSYLYDLTGTSQEPESERYFYNPDHLGSSSWITYTDGRTIEHLHYLPYGETQVDQRATSYAARYTFSAKEKDEETGYSVTSLRSVSSLQFGNVRTSSHCPHLLRRFAARYYNSDLSVWLSVDPMSDKYPNMSPYVYCADNPVKLVDPDGMLVKDPPVHHQFLITVGVQVYNAARKNGASSNGAILVLAQASLESGWGISTMKYMDYNLFGIMGVPSKRSTSHGFVKDYSNSGGYEAAINDYFNRTKDKWSTWSDVLSKDNFSADDIDNALHTGCYYPSKEERSNGEYAYCGNLDANGKNHYGELLMGQFSSTKKRFINSLNYQISENEKIIKQGVPYSNEYLDQIKKENVQYKAILDEIKSF